MVGSDSSLGSYGVDSEDGSVHRIPLEIDLSTEPLWGTETMNPSPKEGRLHLSVAGFPRKFLSSSSGHVHLYLTNVPTKALLYQALLLML